MGKFHAAMYRAVAIERKDVDNPKVLCAVLKGIVDTGKLLAVLGLEKTKLADSKLAAYSKQVDENNALAYEENDVWFLPALRMGSKKLDAKGGIGLATEELRAFLGGS
jgi:hypothetical protein